MLKQPPCFCNPPALFDGPSNVRIDGRVAHFELGQIPELKKSPCPMYCGGGQEPVVELRL
jgi:hypothetical protein